MAPDTGKDLIKIRDRHEGIIHASFSSSDQWRREGAAAYYEIAEFCRKKRPPESNTLSGFEAASYLEDLIEITTREIISRHEKYSSLRWLWYLRRLPDVVFAGQYNTTIAYDRALAEVITGHFHEDEKLGESTSLTYPINPSVFRQINRFVGRVKFLSMLHVLYRRVGKGLELDTTKPILDYKINPEIESAIKQYDLRHDNSFEFQGSRLGLANLNIDSAISEPTKDFSSAYLFFEISPRVEVPIPYIDGSTLRMGLGYANYVPSVLEVKKIVNPMPIKFQKEFYLDNVSALIQLHLMLPSMLHTYPMLLGRILQVGYFSINENLLKKLFNKHLETVNKYLTKNSAVNVYPKTYEAWIDKIHKTPTNTWPLKVGKITRRIQSQIILDIVASTRALIQNIQLDRSPLLGNARAALFEKECQQIINSSSWKPSSDFEEIRGKTLRKNSLQITDIDSIGSKGSVLLMVSCKSIIYDDEYDKGSYRVVKNIQSTIDEAVSYWDGIVNFFKNNPVGDNYDFSSFENIIGIVCTPFVAYSSNQFTYREIRPDLQACISSGELSEWLESDIKIKITQ